MLIITLAKYIKLFWTWIVMTAGFCLLEVFEWRFFGRIEAALCIMFVVINALSRYNRAREYHGFKLPVSIIAFGMILMIFATAQSRATAQLLPNTCETPSGESAKVVALTGKQIAVPISETTSTLCHKSVMLIRTVSDRKRFHKLRLVDADSSDRKCAAIAIIPAGQVVPVSGMRTANIIVLKQHIMSNYETISIVAVADKTLYLHLDIVEAICSAIESKYGGFDSVLVAEDITANNNAVAGVTVKGYLHAKSDRKSARWSIPFRIRMLGMAKFDFEVGPGTELDHDL
jgi:hypothetical protein